MEPWRRGLVVTSPPVTMETGAMGREAESRHFNSEKEMAEGSRTCVQDNDIFFSIVQPCFQQW
jgi:hypothetical protein